MVTLLNVCRQIAHLLILCWLWNYNQYHCFLRNDFMLPMWRRLVSNSSVTWGWLEHHHFLLPPPPECLRFRHTPSRQFTQCWGSHPGPFVCSISTLPAKTHLSHSCQLLESNILLLLSYWKLWLHRNLENFITYGINEWSFPVTLLNILLGYLTKGICAGLFLLIQSGGGGNLNWRNASLKL